MILKNLMLNTKLWSELLVDQSPCEVKHKESAKTSKGIIDQAARPEDFDACCELTASNASMPRKWSQYFIVEWIGLKRFSRNSIHHRLRIGKKMSLPLESL